MRCAARYGCRILQRLLENCHAEQMEDVVKLLLAEALIAGGSPNFGDLLFFIHYQ